MAGPPFRVESAFAALFPHCVIGTVIVRGLDNDRRGAECAALLQYEARSAAERLGDADIATHPAVAPWREAYRAFGVKPAKFRSSIENLLRSARAGTMRSINPLVDLYNAVSLRYMLPCGGEDLDAVQGPIVLTRALGDEHFIPLGSIEEQPPQPGEVIYRDDVGVICRCWNWREADRTKLTASTTDAFLCIEGIPPVGSGEVRAACDELAALVVEHLGGAAEVKLSHDDGNR
jgi:DNA/RNA-binding domain of Phe-tRNA-synthetase-like protein